MATDKGLEEIPEGRSYLLKRYQNFSAALRFILDILLCVFQRRLTICGTTGQIESNYDETTDSFDAMNLKGELLRGTRKLTDKALRGYTDLNQVSMPMVLSALPPSNSVLSCLSSKVVHL